MERIEILRGRFDGVATPRYFVDYVDPAGGRCTVWDGWSYDYAIMTANNLSIQFGTQVFDRVIEGA